MLYADARPLIASGDVLAFGDGTILSRVIRTWTGGSYSHVGVAWRYADRVFVLAAREDRGVGLNALSTQLPAYWLRTGAAWRPDVEALALDRLGLPYDILDAARLALGRAPRHDDEVCSIYAATVLRAAGLALPLPSYTPSGLVAALLAAGADMRAIEPDMPRPAP